jgi:PAS domain S-box-containing protein
MDRRTTNDSTSHDVSAGLGRDRIFGTGEMAVLVRDHDWSLTPLGPIEGWSKEFVTIVNLTLASRSPARTMWGPELILIYNDAYRPIPGPRHPAALGSPAKEVYRESWHVVGPLLENALKTGETLYYEKLSVPLPTNRGIEDRCLNYAFSPVFEDGRIAGLFGTVHDVTSEVVAGRQLKESEARLLRIMESIGDAVIVTDAETRITQMNPIAESLTGWSMQEASGRPLADVFRIVNEDTGEELASPVEALKHTGMIAGLSDRAILIRRDGGKIAIDDSTSPIREDDGQLSGIVLIFRDVGEKRRIEKEKEALLTEIAARYAELEATYNNAAVAMALIDAVEFRYLRVNRKLCEILGLPESQIIGAKVLDVAAGVPGLLEALQRVAAGHTVTGGTLEGELSTSPGAKRYWTVDYSPVARSDGKIVAIAAASAEITVQKQAEAALIQSEKLAAVGRLAPSIAHEINNPLESVTNLLFLIQGHDLSPEVKDYVDTAERELRRVSAIANQTLRFHRQSAEPCPVSSDQLIGEALMIYHGRLVNSKVAVDKRLRAQRAVICSDGEVRQVISNLISNAIDAMSPSGGRLLLRSREGTDHRTGKKALVITVADTGPGMSAETSLRVFDPFFTTKGLAGTGLGLWISKEILERHGGTMSLRSSQRKAATGTVVTISLPF